MLTCRHISRTCTSLLGPVQAGQVQGVGKRCSPGSPGPAPGVASAAVPVPPSPCFSLCQSPRPPPLTQSGKGAFSPRSVTKRYLPCKPLEPPASLRKHENHLAFRMEGPLASVRLAPTSPAFFRACWSSWIKSCSSLPSRYPLPAGTGAPRVRRVAASPFASSGVVLAPARARGDPQRARPSPSTRGGGWDAEHGRGNLEEQGPPSLRPHFLPLRFSERKECKVLGVTQEQ